MNPAEAVRCANEDAPNAMLVDDIAATEAALAADGWTIEIIGKGQFWRNGNRLAFLRSQGTLARPILQWLLCAERRPRAAAQASLFDTEVPR